MEKLATEPSASKVAASGELSHFWEQIDSLRTVPRAGTLSKIKFILSSYKPFLECEQTAASYGPLLQNLVSDVLWLTYQDDASAKDVMECIESHPSFSATANLSATSSILTDLPTRLSTGVACDILQRICDRAVYSERPNTTQQLKIPLRLFLLLKESMFAAIYMNHENLVGVRQQITNMKRETTLRTKSFYSAETYFQRLLTMEQGLEQKQHEIDAMSDHLRSMQRREHMRDSNAFSISSVLRRLEGTNPFPSSHSPLLHPCPLTPLLSTLSIHHLLSAHFYPPPFRPQGMSSAEWEELLSSLSGMDAFLEQLARNRPLLKVSGLQV
jgi:hypothetical protein